MRCAGAVKMDCDERVELLCSPPTAGEREMSPYTPSTSRSTPPTTQPPTHAHQPADRVGRVHLERDRERHVEQVGCTGRPRSAPPTDHTHVEEARQRNQHEVVEVAVQLRQVARHAPPLSFFPRGEYGCGPPPQTGSPLGCPPAPPLLVPAGERRARCCSSRSCCSSLRRSRMAGEQRGLGEGGGERLDGGRALAGDGRGAAR